MVGERGGTGLSPQSGHALGQRPRRGEVGIGATDHAHVRKCHQPVQVDPRGMAAPDDPDPESREGHRVPLPRPTE